MSRIECLSCPKGKYSFGSEPEDHIHCIDCPKGKFCETIGANSINMCLACSKGKWSSILGLNNSNKCISCEPGYYSDTLASTSVLNCKQCDPGKYNPYFGAQQKTDCITAEVGKYSKQGSNESKPCPKGKYNSNTGNSECIDCGLGKYSDVYGTIYCKDCPANSEQSFDKTDWICSEGSYQYINGTYRECMICPKNAICPKGTTLNTLVIKSGYWRRNTTSLNLIECRTKDFCIGGSLHNNSNICRVGHKGPLCDVCIEGYAKIGGYCEICPENNRALNIFLSFLFIVIVSSVLVFLIKTANDIDDSKDEFSCVLKVLTNYLQVFSLAKNFDIKWPRVIVTTFSAAETASGPSIQFYSTQCAIGWSYYERLTVYFIMPIVYILVTLLTLMIINSVNYCKYIYYKKKFIDSGNSVNLKKDLIAYYDSFRKDISDDDIKLEISIESESKDNEMTKDQINKLIEMRDNLGVTFIKKWIKTSLVVGLFLMYPTIIKNLLQIINCSEIDGEYYLNKDYSITCFEGRHYEFALVAYILILIYGLGIPLGSFYFLYQYRNRLYSGSVASSLKFLYIEYKPQRYCGNLIMLKSNYFYRSFYFQEHK